MSTAVDNLTLRINAQWLVSVGSDKAIVVWDWRSGSKVVRFGQQTNVCVGMNLLDNFIITATVDGVIRTFSIAKREMMGQFKLSDFAHRQPEFADKLKDVGVGALGMLTWFAAEGRFLAVSKLFCIADSVCNQGHCHPHGVGLGRRRRTGGNGRGTRESYASYARRQPSPSCCNSTRTP